MSLGDVQEDAEGLARQVRAVFPDLAFSRPVLDDSGGDYRVLVLDGRYAFRFPRGSHHVGLAREIALLRALHRCCATPTPDFRYVDPQFRFAGYAYIPGAALTAARFRSLSAAARERVLGQIAATLAALHSLDPAAILPVHDWPRAWSPAQFAARARDEGLPLLRRHVPQLSAACEDFYAAYADDEAGPERVIHGDLVEEHLLLSPQGDGLAGVIDFGDTSLGDPAQDFMGLWAYGPEAVARVIERYGAGEAAAGLARRSRRAWVRYRLDRLWQGLLWGCSAQEACAAVAAAQAALRLERL